MNKKITYAFVAASLFAAALPVLAQIPTRSPTPSPTPTPRHSPATTATVDLACMQSAIGKRDGAIASAFDTYYNAAKGALTARMSALKAAWGMSDKKARNEAQKKAWSDYRTTVKAARKVFHSAQISAWQQFRTDAKACHGTEEFGSPGADEQL